MPFLCALACFAIALICQSWTVAALAVGTLLVAIVNYEIDRRSEDED
jgi:hypothetical protein